MPKIMGQIFAIVWNENKKITKIMIRGEKEQKRFG